MPKATHVSIPCILTLSCSSLNNLLKILSNSASGVLGMSFTSSLSYTAALFLTWGISSWDNSVNILQFLISSLTRAALFGLVVPLRGTKLGLKPRQ